MQLPRAAAVRHWFQGLSRRRKIALTSTAATLGTILVAMALAPYVIDVGAYKPALVDAVRRATGRDLVIDGPIRLRMFPVPGIGAGNVKFANARGAKGAQMVSVRWVSVRPSWEALLQGRIEVGTLTLYRPDIELETDADGRPNWDFSPAARGTNQPAGAPAAGLHLAIGKLAIVNGTVRYTNPKTQKLFVAENLNMQASVGSFDGPLDIAGHGTVNDVPLDLDLKIGPPSEKGNDAALLVQVASGKLQFAGTISKVSPDAAMVGHVSVETGLLTDYIHDLLRASGKDVPAFRGSLIGNFSFDSDIEILPERVAVKDFTLAMGREQAKGTLALAAGPVPSIEGKVALNYLDLEKWQAAVSDQRFADLLAPKIDPAAKAAPATKPTPPPQIDARVTVDVAKILYHERWIRDLSLTFQVAKGALDVPLISATFPGDMKLHVVSGGTFFFGGPRLRETLGWLRVDTSRVPADKLGSIKVGGRVKSSAGHLELSDATFDLDNLHATGGATVALAAPLATTLRLDFDRLDLDAYFPKGAGPREAGSSTTAMPVAAATSALAPSLGVKAKAAKLVWRGETLNGVAADVAMQGSVLKLNEVQIADVVGAKLGLRGEIKDMATTPRFDLTFSGAASDTDRLLAFLELPKPMDGKIGAASVSGGASGTAQDLTLRNVAVDLLGVSARATGRLDLAPTLAFDFSVFQLKSEDASHLIGAARGRPMASIGSIAFDGALKGSAEHATYKGAVDAMGVKVNGTIEAAFGPRPKISADLSAPEGIDLGKWLGMPAPTPTPAPTQPKRPGATASAAMVAPPVGPSLDSSPIDLSGLRAFDAVLVVHDSGASLSSVKLASGNLEANLSRGVIKITRLSGQLFGGGADFTGTIDASGAGVGIDLKGDIRGVKLGEVLIGTAGRSSFGNSDLTVAIDGSLDATGIQLAGKGASAAEICQGLQGGAALSGFLQPSVVKGSLSFAQGATGFFGIFDTELAFDSLVLKNFVDHRNTLSGDLRFNGLAVVTENPTLRGQNATAVIAGRTDLVAATTDMQVILSGGGDNFVVTLKGPLASPAMAAARGK
jgi:hypothetical protein